MKSKHHKAVTERFKQAVNTIIYQNKQKGKSPSNMSAFAESIGDNQQNFGKLWSKGQDVTSRLLEPTFRLYGVNPAWIYLNRGEMFLKDEVPLSKEIANLIKQMETLTGKLEQLQKTETKLKRRA